jgi:predicted nucleotidyltransferase
MTTEQALILLREAVPSLQALGLTYLALVGSTARGQATPQSDVDVLVDFEGPGRFQRHLAIADLLTAHLQCHVDVISRRALKQRALDVMENEAIRVA